MSLIESLVGAPVIRPDRKRILPRRRPLFQRPRDVFDLLVSLGAEASIASIVQSIDLKHAEPRTLTQVFLSRVLSEAELTALPTPYQAQIHVRELLLGREFRASLFHRVCNAYPERPRFLFIRIPHCAGQHFAAMADARHPLYPDDIAAFQRGDAARFIPALGAYAARFGPTRTLFAIQPTLAAFMPPSATPAASSSTTLASGLVPLAPAPLYRPGDRLFSILRPPAALLLAHVNQTITALKQPPETDSPATATIRAALPAAKTAQPALADLLRALPFQNPICHAFANGTAAASLRAVRHHDVELADLSTYNDWVKYTWDVEPSPPANRSTPHVTAADLATADTAPLIGEDETFYKVFAQALSLCGDQRYAVRGRDL